MIEPWTTPLLPRPPPMLCRLHLLCTDIAEALTAHAVDIVTPIPQLDLALALPRRADLVLLALHEVLERSGFFFLSLARFLAFVLATELAACCAAQEARRAITLVAVPFQNTANI